MALLGEVKPAFLQIGTNKEERNALRIRWVKDLKTMEIIFLRFTRLSFGSTPSSFILNVTLMEHLEACIKKQENKAVVEEIQDDLFVDDLTSGRINEQETQEIKDTATRVIAERSFTLHKWHSNIPLLEKSAATIEGNEETVTYAKEDLVTKSTKAKILGVYWKKQNDTLVVDFQACKDNVNSEVTKRNILRAMASVYDPLGVASPMLLVAKQLYRNICDEKIA